MIPEEIIGRLALAVSITCVVSCSIMFLVNKFSNNAKSEGDKDE